MAVRRVLTAAETGARIRAARIARGFAHHADLSEALGRDEDGSRVALSTISKWETGRAKPERHLLRLAQVLEVPLEHLMYADDAGEDHLSRAARALAAAGINEREAEPVLARLAQMSTRDVQEILGLYKPPSKRPSQRPDAYSGVRELVPAQDAPRKRRSKR